MHVCCRKEDTGREGSLNDQCGQASRVGIPAQKKQILIPACLFYRRKLGLMSWQVLCHSSSFLGLNFFFFSYSTAAWFLVPFTKSFHRCSDATGTTYFVKPLKTEVGRNSVFCIKTKQNRTLALSCLHEQ